MTTDTHTIPERATMFATALISIAVAAFVSARIYPIRHVLLPRDAQAAIGLLLAAALLGFGVTMIVEWRRKRREITPQPQVPRAVVLCDRFIKYAEEAAAAIYPAPAADEDVRLSRVDSRLRAVAELECHLTGALAVLLREPDLMIDAGTLRMLAKHKAKPPAPVRDEKGRWRSVQ